MSHTSNSVWLSRVPRISVFTFESNRVQYVNVKTEIGEVGSNSDYAYFEIVFNSIEQIDELVDALSDARVLLEEGEDPCDIQELVL